ncbi:MAG: beta-lactamase family protein, partial [Lachnospiraceae bacterium]|nr:beta-lactamase family protein [Lachnospiraceae bacterium]
DKLVAEGYYAPCSADSLHRLFSVCKTLNAIAIGILAADGKLRLSDSITDYFPDKLPEPLHPWIKSMTIRDLLMMRTCHTSTTYKHDIQKEWVESFFTTPPSHKPGTVFHYDTSASHVLCALVERLTGKPMLDFLRSRVLDEIGWSKTSYVLKNDFGDSQGGSGLMAASRDLLLLGYLLLKNGNIGGRQLLPEEFIQEMTSNLTPNALTGGVISERQGYGYQIWRTCHNGFVCYGMGGQLALCLPKQDMIMVTTADTQGLNGGNDLIYNSFYEEILPALDTLPCDAKSESESADRLSKRLSALSLAPLKRHCRPSSPCITGVSFLEPSACAEQINKKTARLTANSQGFSDISFSFTADAGTLRYSLRGEACSDSFGPNSCATGIFPIYNMRYASSGIWLSENTLYLKIHIIDTFVGSIHMEFVFGEHDVTIFMKKIEETQFNEYTGHFYG